jgi:hypothetical protein
LHDLDVVVEPFVAEKMPDPRCGQRWLRTGADPDLRERAGPLRHGTSLGGRRPVQVGYWHTNIGNNEAVSITKLQLEHLVWQGHEGGRSYPKQSPLLFLDEP